MRSIVFAKRNVKEYIRSPLMLFFTLLFPLILFLIFQLIKLGTGATDEIVPMFAVVNLVPSICIFSFTFVAMNLSLQIAKDKASSLQARLKVSPLREWDFFLGYFLPSLAIAILQIVIAFIVGICFRLPVSLSILYAAPVLAVISVFYISLGILIGSLCSEKACGGISSIFINVTALFSGMFFPLQAGTFKNILSAFPFLPSVALPQALLQGAYTDLPLYALVLGGYSVIVITLSVFVFKKRLKE